MDGSKARTIECAKCGASLPIPDVETGVVKCEYCGTDNAIGAGPGREVPAGEVTFTESAEGGESVLARGAGAVGGERGIAGTSPVRAKQGRLAAILIVAVILLAGAAASIFLSRPGSPIDNSVRGDLKGIVESAAVAPSFEKADPVATAVEIARMVRSGWRRNALAGRVYASKVGTDGTMNLQEGQEAVLSVSFYDKSGLDRLVPGETSLKGAGLSSSVLNGYVAGFKDQDVPVSTIRDADVLWTPDEGPGCGAAALWAEARKAGYPEGWATISFPVVPYDLTLKGVEFKVAFESDRDVLGKALEAAGWDARPYRAFEFSIPGWDAGGLPRYFGIGDCKPMDVERVLEGAIESLRNAARRGGG